jgi:iron complex transport system ATP-binding protein
MTLEIRDLAVRYGDRMAVRPLSSTVTTGEFVALVGPNGAGKSSLLKGIAGLLPHDGRASWNGQPLEALEPRARAQLVAYLPQAPALHWPMRARDLVALGRLPHRAYGAAPNAADADATNWALEQTETTALAERNVDQLSIGERARVLLARALAVQAPTLLVDEPIAMLDPYHQLQVMAMLRDYANGSADAAPRREATDGPGPGTGPVRDRAAGGTQGALVIAVLHDLALAARFCSRVLLLDDGAVVGDDRPERALKADALARHYRVEPFVTTHEGEPLIVPWRRLG